MLFPKIEVQSSHCVVDDEEEEVPAKVVTARHVTIEVKVPRDTVGAVIGVQGANIKKVTYNLLDIERVHYFNPMNIKNVS